MPIFNNVTDCRECPCRNDGFESGCSLEYKVVMEWMEDKTLIECSHGCRLTVVDYAEGEHHQVKTTTTPTSPGEWAWKPEV